MENMIRKVDEIAARDRGEMEIIARDDGATLGVGKTRGGDMRETKDEGDEGQTEENVTDNKPITVKEEFRNDEFTHYGYNIIIRVVCRGT